MKHEWRKKEKAIYLPKTIPELISVPPYKYVTLSGKGHPASTEFSDKIGVLYNISYAIRMMPKSGFTPDGYYEYTVYPLEGLWDLTEEGKRLKTFDKNELMYTIMIRQPDFVTDEIFEMAYKSVKKKKNPNYLDDLRFETIEDGLSVQMMHHGSYDNEPQSFAQMKQYIEDHNLILTTLKHREIYLSDFRKTEPDKLKTVLRYTSLLRDKD
jgi:hypothetical protein